MASKYTPRVYCDSCIFIAFLKGNEVVDGVNRSEVCARVLEDAQNGTIELYTSWVSFAECPKPHQPIKFGEDEIESAEQLFNYEFIRKSDAERFICTEARLIQAKASGNEGDQNLLKNQPASAKKIKRLRPFDAVHVATALDQEVDYLFTYDEDHLMPLCGHEIVSGLKICKPYRPWDSQMSIFENPGGAE